MKVKEFLTASPIIVLETLKKENPTLYARLMEHAKAQLRPTKSKEVASKELLESISGSRII